MNKVLTERDAVARLVAQLRAQARDDGAAIRVDSLVRLLGSDAHVLLILIAALPNCVPGPPGYGSLLGLITLAISWRMALSRAIVLPDFIARRELPISLLVRLLEAFDSALHHPRKLMRPRLTWLTSRRASRALAVYVMVLALGVVIPIPLTSFLPALATALICLALMARDGLMVAFAVAVGLVGLSVVAFAVAAIIGALIFVEELMLEE